MDSGYAEHDADGTWVTDDSDDDGRGGGGHGGYGKGGGGAWNGQSEDYGDTRELSREWKAVTKDYDPERLYTRATDNHGHSEQQRLRIPGWMAGGLRQNANVYGISMQDLIRNYVVHGLVRDSRRPKDDPIFRVPGDVLISQMLQQTEEKMQRWEGAREELRQVMDGLIERLEFETAHHHLESALTGVDDEDMSPVALQKYQEVALECKSRLMMAEERFAMETEFRVREQARRAGK